MSSLPPGTTDQTLRLTLRWVVLAVVLLFGIGIVGGLVGQQLLAPPVTPLSSTADRVVSTVQEVTISPNTAVAQVVANVGRSVVLLGVRAGTTIQPVATASVVTNDGLLATTASLATGDVVALDDTGAAIALDRVGVDTMYGISYWRMPQSIVVPLDLRREPFNVGTELLAMSRSEVTRHLKVVPYRVQEFSLPHDSDSVGLQQIIQGPEGLPGLVVGAPVVDEEGHVAGLVMDTGGRVIGVDALEVSLRRLAAEQREFDPLQKAGLGLDFSFAATPGKPDQLSFVARITAITPGAPAATARLQRGDSITMIQDEPVSWEKNVVQQLSAAFPLKLSILRGGETLTATLQEPVPAE